ncbi:hypothetical protein GUITHDRAFT_113513 [Guillardia theta CCMP2712]|uniref:Uncharacterized protein n=1 Tax=Guillardia theta (strain CCMP2712) TaxID=905079 RepID=L1IWK7_GUITC|nr:hypothetical protein GUITHDRAFT_113513 [Guillardia theta CCMP2712]EKX40482.1 hypothetical protein GUITHDRAFT_113513 [Guillardia theta CCMP2712]|eukprot:XP_005827462.1 hypothetical protein GUITHDRAFT_113513 [Guillardia theta CCMP2712]
MTALENISAIPNFERGRLSPVAKIRSDVAMTRRSLDLPQPRNDPDRFSIRHKKNVVMIPPTTRDRRISMPDEPSFSWSPEPDTATNGKQDSTGGWAVSSVKGQAQSRQARDLSIMRKWHTIDTIDASQGMDDLLGRDGLNSPVAGSKKHPTSLDADQQGHKKGKGSSSPLMRVRSRVFAAIQMMPATSRYKAKNLPQGTLAPLDHHIPSFGADRAAMDIKEEDEEEVNHAAEDFSDSLIHNLIEQQRENFEIYRKYLNKADSL